MAVDRSVRDLSELQQRILVLCDQLRPSANHSILVEAFDVSEFEFLNAIGDLEESGSLFCRNEMLEPSALISAASAKRLRSATIRLDGLRCADSMLKDLNSASSPGTFYQILRLLILARESARAISFLKSYIGKLIRHDTAQRIVHELERARRDCSCEKLNRAIDGICGAVLAGSANKRRHGNAEKARDKDSPLAFVSVVSSEVEYTYSSPEALKVTMTSSRNPNLPPAERLAEATTALFVAFNRNDPLAVDAAYMAVDAVRHSNLVNQFDICRADLMYSAFMGDRLGALASSRALATQSRIVENVELACLGLRNSAEAQAAFGDIAGAQCLLLEARSLASRLEYNAQIVWSDLELASLALRVMDVDASSAYLTSAAETCRTFGLDSPLIMVDQLFHQCWESLIRGDIGEAQRAARGIARRVKRSESGTLLWCRLAVELATHRGARTRVERNSFDQLKQSIGSCAYYSNEQLSLTAILLYAKGTPDHESVSGFVREQFERLEATGRTLWPFLLSNLSST